MKCAIIYNGKIRETREYKKLPAAKYIRHIDGLPVVRPVVSTKPPLGVWEKHGPPTYTIHDDHVDEEYTIVPLNTEERIFVLRKELGNLDRVKGYKALQSVLVLLKSQLPPSVQKYVDDRQTIEDQIESLGG